MFPINNVLKQGDVLSSLLCNFVLKYAIMRVQVNQDGLKLNGIHNLLFMLMMLVYWGKHAYPKETRRIFSSCK
jgi:hypothetical protein